MKKIVVFATFFGVLWCIWSVNSYAEINSASSQLDDLKLGIPTFDLIYWMDNDKEIIVNQTDERSKIFGVTISQKCRLVIKLESDSELFKIHLQDIKGNDLKKSASIYSFAGGKGYLGESILYSASAGKYFIKVMINDEQGTFQPPQSYKLIVIPDVSEPNGLRSNAVPVVFSEIPFIKKNSVIDSKYDIDWYKVTIKNNEQMKSHFIIYLSPAEGRSENTLSWRLEDDQGKVLVEQYDYEEWFQTTLVPGTYYVRVAYDGLQLLRRSYRRYEILFGCNPAVIAYSLVSDLAGDKSSNKSIPPVMTKKEMLSNAPNPFNPETDIAYEVPEHGHVELSVFTTKGKKVVELVNGNKTVGSHSIHWNGKDSRGKDMPSGVYYAVFEVNGKRFTKKMIMLK